MKTYILIETWNVDYDEQHITNKIVSNKVSDLIQFIVNNGYMEKLDTGTYYYAIEIWENLQLLQNIDLYNMSVFEKIN